MKYLILILFLGIKCNAQLVSNITFQREANNFMIYYDLETKSTSIVSLYFSINRGTTWHGPLKKVFGDVGININSGKHLITWNLKEEFAELEEIKADDFIFKVNANQKIETVVIGNQEWTTKNLDVSKYRNGDLIPEVKDYYQWLSLTSGAWCYYNNDSNNGVLYGKLYNWYAVNDPRGLAPEGYHIPSEKEWIALRNYLNIGYKFDVSNVKLVNYYTPLIEVFTIHMNVKNIEWPSQLMNLVNNTGFSGLFGGKKQCKRSNYGFENLKDSGFFWSSNSINTYFKITNNYISELCNDCLDIKPGYSIRCIKD